MREWSSRKQDKSFLLVQKGCLSLKVDQFEGKWSISWSSPEFTHADLEAVYDEPDLRNMIDNVPPDVLSKYSATMVFAPSCGLALDKTSQIKVHGQPKGYALLSCCLERSASCSAVVME